MKDKTVLITGANSGLGLATAKALAKKSFDLILLCRSEKKGMDAMADIQRDTPTVKIKLVTADLADLDSVREVAKKISQDYSRLDILINNAGYTPATIEFTPDSIEKSFYASHVGHFVLTWHLLDLLKRTAAETGDVRIINLSSAAHMMGKKARFFRHIEDLSTWSAYGDDKLANILFTKGLARQLDGTGIRAYSVHPGAVRTNFGGDTPGFVGKLLKVASPLMRSPENGAKTSVFLASSPLKSIGERNNGSYFADSQSKAASNRDVTDENADWLWEKSLAFV
jgi:NAD(P)-dependent dehydrogenase (short-subunit alcohol dehydrogenase family)